MELNEALPPPEDPSAAVRPSGCAPQRSRMEDLCWTSPGFAAVRDQNCLSLSHISLSRSPKALCDPHLRKPPRSSPGDGFTSSGCL